jgi:putative nucleotidyltransferase with HDIG domain
VISREEALTLVERHLKHKNLIKHVLAVESIMLALADKYDENKELWGLAGLLHDIDYEETKEKPMRHGYRTLEIISDLGLPEEIHNAILAHAGHTDGLGCRFRGKAFQRKEVRCGCEPRSYCKL